jgi:phosphoribosyl 1,2-cyclic phosphodiesterase
MNAIALQSDSSGNSIYVEAGDTAIIFDAGISGIKAEERLAAHGRDIRHVSAVIISHDHGDHTRSAGIYQRKYGLPVHITEETFRAANYNGGLGKMNDVRHFAAGDTLSFNGLTVETIPTPHDAADGLVFVVTAGKKRLGILTDLGHPFDALSDIIPTLNGVFLESNYEPDMLENGPYPHYLKERISGPNGHISNDEAADLLRARAKKLDWAFLAHLSGENNSPQTALTTHRRLASPNYPLYAAIRGQAGEMLAL